MAHTVHKKSQGCVVLPVQTLCNLLMQWCFISDQNTASMMSERCEKDPSHLPLGIAIDNLVKVKQKLATQ